MNDCMDYQTNRRVSKSWTGLVAVGVIVLGLAHPAEAQTVENPTRFDVSPRFDAIRPLPRQLGIFLQEHRVKKLAPPAAKLAAAADTVLQRTATTNLALAPIAAFPGVGQDTSYTVTSDPPDTNGSVGKKHYVQWVNTGLAIFEKSTGKRILGPVDGNLLWQGFGGNCEQYNDGDPIVLYDRIADRWLLTQFAVTKPPYSQCIAISTTDDPAGTYARYEFQYQDFNDYPKFGVWPDAYYGTFNMFRGQQMLGSKACAFERSKMIAGQSARMVCFDVPGQAGLLPSDLDGKTPPPAGAPNYLMNFGSDELNMWKFHVDWASPGSSTLAGPSRTVTSPFEIACRTAPVIGECVRQPNTSERLDTLSDRLMFRLAYRRFADHESLVVNHAVTVGNSSGVRWYEVRDPGGTPTVFQQGTYAPDAAFRWMGSIAMDKMGNMLMGYSVSSAKIYPSIRFTGRSAGDPLNQMGAEQRGIEGKGSQQNPERWGDYASMSVDPDDDCTFWFTTQYLAKTGKYNWSTSILRTKYPNCQ